MECKKCGGELKLIYKRAWECKECGHSEYIATKDDYFGKRDDNGRLKYKKAIAEKVESIKNLISKNP